MTFCFGIHLFLSRYVCRYTVIPTNEQGSCFLSMPQGLPKNSLGSLKGNPQISFRVAGGHTEFEVGAGFYEVLRGFYRLDDFGRARRAVMKVIRCAECNQYDELVQITTFKRLLCSLRCPRVCLLSDLLILLWGAPGGYINLPRCVLPGCAKIMQILHVSESPSSW